MSSYVTNVNTKAGGSVYVDIGTLFCDNSYNQILGGNKTFTGTVYVPTPATDASRTEVVTAAWIRTGYAPINSPTFTGTPLAPTPATDASLTQLVTAEWTKNYTNANFTNRFPTIAFTTDQNPLTLFTGSYASDTCLMYLGWTAAGDVNFGFVQRGSGNAKQICSDGGGVTCNGTTIRSGATSSILYIYRIQNT
jgi:hypothetical protein